MDRQSITEKCVGCTKILAQETMFQGGPVFICMAYLDPPAKWRIGNCPMATHLQKEIKKQGFVDPLKASKKSMKGKH